MAIWLEVCARCGVFHASLRTGGKVGEPLRLVVISTVHIAIAAVCAGNEMLILHLAALVSAVVLELAGQCVGTG